MMVTFTIEHWDSQLERMFTVDPDGFDRVDAKSMVDINDNEGDSYSDR